MSNSYLLGAIESIHGYTNIINVQKGQKYKCIACQSDLILRKGEKRFQSLIHKGGKGCQYFKNPTNEQLIEDARLHLSKLIEINNIDILRKCSICKMPCKMNFTNIDNFKLYLIKDDEEYLKKENQQYYYINIEQLIKYIRSDYATKRIEIFCSYFTTCEECKIKYNV